MGEQLKLSRLRDREIDKHFADKWRISKELPRGLEKLGIDRIWIHRETGRRWSVEYKHDTIAHRTENGFVETVSVVEANKLGWAYTSCAQMLIYYVVEGEYAFVLRMEDVERRVDLWRIQYPEKDTTTVDKSTGESYRTRGVLVPLFVLRAISEKVPPVYSGDEPTPLRPTIPLKRGSGVLR